jgi:hypothetical protein
VQIVFHVIELVNNVMELKVTNAFHVLLVYTFMMDIAVMSVHRKHIQTKIHTNVQIVMINVSFVLVIL